MEQEQRQQLPRAWSAQCDRRALRVAHLQRPQDAEARGRRVRP